MTALNITKKEIKRIYNVGKLLSTGDSNTKTAKNPIKSFILHLSPARKNSTGQNVCSHASTGCINACLDTSGLGGVYPSISKARIAKTDYFFAAKPIFIQHLANEIIREYDKAKKEGIKIAIRLNGTSDIDLVYMLKKYADLDILTLKEHAVFYDYTAILQKALRYKEHANYFVTFSMKEDNHEKVDIALNSGVNVAAVFAGDLPTEYKGIEVVNGDQNDIVMIYKAGIILGLKAKGKAKNDFSGFVIRDYKQLKKVA